MANTHVLDIFVISVNKKQIRALYLAGDHPGWLTACDSVTVTPLDQLELFCTLDSHIVPSRMEKYIGKFARAELRPIHGRDKHFMPRLYLRISHVTDAT